MRYDDNNRDRMYDFLLIDSLWKYISRLVKKAFGKQPNRLIIIEGPDNVGKTSIAKELEKHLEYSKYVYQPSGENSVGFIREIVKTDKSIGSFSRQLLHTASHLVDLIETFNYNVRDTYIMDRSFVSTHIYSKLLGLKDKSVDILDRLNKDFYLKTFAERGVEVIFIYIVNDKPFAEDNDVYSDKIKWSDLYNMYKEYFTDKDIKAKLGYGNRLIMIRNDKLDDTVSELLEMLK